LRVLIVDDNRDAADSQAVLVRLWGHETRVAYDGEHAVAESAGFVPDVVLLDLGMPRLDGFAVARRLREQAGPSGRLVLVAVTGYGDPQTHQRLREAGIDHFLLKPADLEALGRLLAAQR
jgi:CheY-like chemotaxis protein